MKTSNILILFALALILNACATKEPVAMNLYDPNSGEVEQTSGICVVITQDMIDKAK